MTQCLCDRCKNVLNSRNSSHIERNIRLEDTTNKTVSCRFIANTPILYVSYEDICNRCKEELYVKFLTQELKRVEGVKEANE